MNEDQLELLRRAKKGNKAACDQLIRLNTPLVWSIARRFFGRGCEPDDLFQLGCIGLLKAICGFEESFGTHFSTYAVPKIGGEIKRFLRDDGMIKVSRTLKENATKVAQAKAAFEKERGREAHLSEIALATGLDMGEIAACLDACLYTYSLDAETEDGLSLSGTLAGENYEEQTVEKIAVKEVLARLPERQRAVIALRFFKDMTQQKVAEALGMTQVQVSRTEKRALLMIRQMLITK